jgi:predicted ATP-dependent endonuclease of OLD family
MSRLAIAMGAERSDEPSPTAADEVIAAADEALAHTANAWTRSASKHLGRELKLEFDSDDYSRLETIIEAAIGDMIALIDRQPVERQGSGTRRALLMSALDLFTDEDLWPSDASVIYLLEEPEIGLDPTAQRRVAAALKNLVGFGVQSIVVTHSPILVNAASASGIRIASLEDDGEELTGRLTKPAFHHATSG